MAFLAFPEQEATWRVRFGVWGLGFRVRTTSNSQLAATGKKGLGLLRA